MSYEDDFLEQYRSFAMPKREEERKINRPVKGTAEKFNAGQNQNLRSTAGGGRTFYPIVVRPVVIREASSPGWENIALLFFFFLLFVLYCNHQHTHHLLMVAEIISIAREGKKTQS